MFHGVEASVLREHVVEALVADRRDGVARGEAWPAESGRIFSRTMQRLDCYPTPDSASGCQPKHPDDHDGHDG